MVLLILHEARRVKPHAPRNNITSPVVMAHDQYFIYPVYLFKAQRCPIRDDAVTISV